MGEIDNKGNNLLFQDESLNGFISHILQAETEIAQVEAKIMNKVDYMFETITNLIQLINPIEEHYTSVDDINITDSINIPLKKERVINQQVIENLNKMADGLAKVMHGLSDLIGESLDSLGDCKEARGRLLESLCKVSDKKSK